MGAHEPRRRKDTARDLAAKHDRSPRTIRRVIAEPRHQFEERARQRQQQALALRADGLTYREIAAALNISKDASAGLVRRAKVNSSRR